MRKFLIIAALFPIAINALCPTIISRSEWGAAESRSNRLLRNTPTPYVLIHHTVTGECRTTSACKSIVKGIQNDHMNNKNKKYADIGYNFLIGGDGNVYEGRGWDKHGSHEIKYNGRSIGISFIGNFSGSSPTQAQIQAAKDLIQCGIEKNKISRNYKLIGHRQAKSTKCPGDILFGLIQSWGHFEAHPS